MPGCTIVFANLLFGLLTIGNRCFTVPCSYPMKQSISHMNVNSNSVYTIVNAHLMKVFYFIAVLSFSDASRRSFGVRVYTRPVTVLGSTLVIMSLKEMLRMSGLCGYLNDREGPLGCRKLTLTSSFTCLKNTSHPPLIITIDCDSFFFRTT